MDKLKLALALMVCLLAGALGALFTTPAIPTWYAGLSKPSFSPPNWLFAPVWTLLYVLMGGAAYLVWMKGWKQREVRAALGVFGVQLVLNFLWSVAFFGMHSPLYGLVVIAALWAAIALTIVRFRGVSRPAAWLLVPYLLWVSFAAYLNYSVWALN